MLLDIKHNYCVWFLSKSLDLKKDVTRNMNVTDGER